MENKESVAKYRNTLTGRLLGLYHSAKMRAKKKNLQFTIAQADIEELYFRQEGKCAITNLKMSLITGHKHRANSFVVSLDRINSEVGYIKENIQLVCWQVNRMKDSLTMEELEFWIKTISREAFSNEGTFNDYPERE
jgi:hypothetical protein